MKSLYRLFAFSKNQKLVDYYHVKWKGQQMMWLFGRESWQQQLAYLFDWAPLRPTHRDVAFVNENVKIPRKLCGSERFDLFSSVPWQLISKFSCMVLFFFLTTVAHNAWRTVFWKHLNLFIMVYYFKSRCGEFTMYMGKDKYENEDLSEFFFAFILGPKTVHLLTHHGYRPRRSSFI